MLLKIKHSNKETAAKTSILNSTGRDSSVIEVWQLDLTSSASVQSFAARANELERQDIVVQNAGVLVHNFKRIRSNKKTITVNVINAFLLALLLLPKLRSTSTELNKEIVMTFTGYPLSKLLELLAFRELSAITRSSKPSSIVTSMVNPSSVLTGLDREGRGLRGLIWSVYGSRTLVHAAQGGRDTHGQYLDDCKVGRTSDFINSEVGRDAQRKFWGELMAVPEDIEGGITQNL
ncbi:putative short-chain dehydrogenase/reductase family protein [Xylaria arbuscula]|nr:putative short-chain dehydrogenase/reductase family protein [Xylaria arbuscula]